MARKGSEKRRTGCITCKKRRVKCDEERPTCQRCQHGKRECAYAVPPVGCYSWHHLLHCSSSITPHPSRRLPDPMARSLDFFKCEAASKIGGELDSAFWTSAVMRVAMTEDAALHGMTAISLLYEGFEPSWKKQGENEEALKHYNQALRLVASRELGTAAVLVMSILFTCIEFLRGNEAAAVIHCRHGTLVSQLPGQREGEVTAMLRQLSTFPYFFSSGNFPALSAMTQPKRFESVSQAAYAMHDLLAHGGRLVRSLDGYRLGFEDGAMPAGARDAQLTMLRNLTFWKAAYDDLRNRCKIGSSSHALLMMRFQACWIWSCISLRRDELASDSFEADFKKMVELASQVPTEKFSEGAFSFSMGISPLLHFVVIKCRHLPTRLKALEMLRRMGKRRESLWDAVTMCRIGELMVEIEHGVRVVPGMEVPEWAFPEDEKRIRDTYFEGDVVVEPDDMGNEILRRRLHLFVCEGEAITKRTDWISLKR